MYFFLLDLRVLDHGYREYWDRLVPEIRERGLFGERKEIVSDQEVVQELARIIKQKRFQTVVVVGGDGLLACAASAAAGSGLALGYVPLGGSCAFGQRWNISSQVGVVGDRLAARRLRDVDLLKIGRSYVIDHLRIGQAMQTRSTGQKRPSLLGSLKKAFSSGRAQDKEKDSGEFRVIVEREGLEAYLTSIGMMIEINPVIPAAQAKDQHFVLMSSTRQKKAILWDQIGAQPDGGAPQVTRLHLSDCSVTFDRPVPVRLDGFDAELSGQVQVKLVPSPVKIIV